MRPINIRVARAVVRKSGIDLTPEPMPLSAWSFLWALLAMVLCISTAAQQPDAPAIKNQAAPASAINRVSVAGNYGKLPLSFEANRGQSDRQVKFLSRGNGYALFLTDSAAVLSLNKPYSAKAKPHNPGAPERALTSKTDVIRMVLPGAKHSLQVGGIGQLPGTANYFIGNDPSRWHSAVPMFSKVRYSEVYPGVDLVYYGNQRQLEYDFVVAPNADATPVRLRFAGATTLRLDAAGDLHVIAKNGEVAFHKPLVYQEIQGRRQAVEGRFALLGKNIIGFTLGAYDTTRALIIDPVLVYSTYLGGSLDDGIEAIAVDTSGNAYVTGFSASTDFPVTSGAYDSTNTSSGYDAFITKLNPTGTALLYSTYLGGSAGGLTTSIAVDSSGNAYVAGDTKSLDFPVTAGAFQTTDPAKTVGNATGFVSAINSTGTALIYSTYLGGSIGAQPFGIAVDSSADAFVTGNTGSPDFPVTAGAFQMQTITDCAFVTKFNPTGTGLIYSTLLGGGFGDAAQGIALDSSGDAYITGNTSSSDFPVTSGAYQTTNNAFANDGANAFVAKFNATGTALVYSTFIGGTVNDGAWAIALDSSNNAFVAGQTTSPDFPVTSGAFQTTNPLESAFVTKLNATGTALDYSTFLGGTTVGGPVFNIAYGIAVDSAGDAYVTGVTPSTDFPVTPGAFQTTNKEGANGAAFVTRLNPTGTALLYSTYLAGSNGLNGNTAHGIAIDGSGDAYVAGFTTATDFPVTSGAFQSTNKAVTSFTGFVTQLNLNSSLIGTATMLTSSANPQNAGSPVTFTVTVAPASGTGTPTGTISSTIDGGPGPHGALVNGAVQFTTSTLSAGTHTIVATYTPDGSSSGLSSSSATLVETINGGAQTAATLTTPTPGSAFTSYNVTFAWAPVSGATQYELRLGSTGVGSSNLYNSGDLAAASVTAHFLPANGETIYARLYTNFNGTWLFSDATYTALASATLTSPAAGSALAGPSVTFTWAAFTGATEYELRLGSTGVGSSDLYNSGETTATSVTANFLPMNGETIYGRLYTSLNGYWGYTDFTYTAAALATLTSPTAGSAFAGPSVAFTWTALPGATEYELQLGSTGVGSSNLYNSGDTTVTSVTDPFLPLNGETIYARLYTNFHGQWGYTDSTYTAVAPAALTTPTPASTLTGSSVTFMWTGVAQATDYELWLGTSPGSNNLYRSAHVTGTSITVSGLPTNGETIYARIYTSFNGNWGFNDFTYTAQ